MDEYSVKEKMLLKYFEVEYLVNNLIPLGVYNIMIKESFMRDDRSKYTESLRRCIKAFECSDNKKIYRLTKEFDDLIEI